MQERDLQPDVLTYLPSINALGQAHPPEPALEAGGGMQRRCPEPSGVISDSLANVVTETPERGLQPDVPAYNSLIDAFVRADQPEQASEVLGKAVRPERASEALGEGAAARPAARRRQLLGGQGPCPMSS